MIFRILEFAVCLVLEWYNILSPFDKLLALLLIEYLKYVWKKEWPLIWEEIQDTITEYIKMKSKEYCIACQ